MKQRIRLGMVGGGEGAFIGEVHRIAARIDNRFELLAGALSSDATRAANSAEALGIDSARSYSDYQQMASAEAARPDGIDAVVIVTPNHLHFPVAKTFLEAGIHVICDKPLCNSVADAEALIELQRSSGCQFMVTYNYSGYPMVRQARDMVAAGELGTLRVVQVEYAQDWLATKLEAEGQKQAAWRTDPAQAGAGGSIGDIGTHALQLLEFISGSQVKSLAADLSSYVDGRELDDNAHIFLRLHSGAKGMLWVSQVAAGKENGLRIRLYGDKAGLEWAQEDPNYLRFTPLGESPRLLSRGGPGLGATATSAIRIPAGHPEGFLEGFANLYRDFADLIQGQVQADASLIPTLEDGRRGVRFIDAAIQSDRQDTRWVDL